MTERNRRTWSNRGAGAGNAVYGLGLIGALVYYIQTADGFWSVILGILKAIERYSERLMVHCGR